MCSRAVDELLQKRRGDVVGKIADEMKRVARESGEIHFERIAFDDLDVARHGGAQLWNEVAVDFNGDDAACSGGEFARQRAGARADFDNACLQG